MMPLSMAPTCEKMVIVKIKGKDETKRFLENLGFVQGGDVDVISQIGGNMIVNVKNVRIAVSKYMANRILVNVKEG
ncbi:MAG: ferrous iron transport protein A [Clostridia bacterium]|nr:ferrous iron transport protein A [Clostridia bacterium]MCI2015471.1 ferrous iron transport protein A [Clostridia bacterium]